MHTAVQQYIQQFKTPVIELLQSIRTFILAAHNGIEEGFSYGLPTYYVNGKVIVHIGAFKQHIGVYALPTAHEHFAKQLQPYKKGKGSVQFLYSQPFPFDVVQQMLLFNIKQQKVATKTNNK